MKQIGFPSLIGLALRTSHPYQLFSVYYYPVDTPRCMVYPESEPRFPDAILFLRIVLGFLTFLLLLAQFCILAPAGFMFYTLWLSGPRLRALQATQQEVRLIIAGGPSSLSSVD